MESQITRAGAEVLAFKAGRSGLFKADSNVALLDSILKSGISLIHVHHHTISPAARALADAANIPLVQTCTEAPPHEGFFSRRTAKRQLTGRPIVVPSEYLRSLVVERFDIPQNEIKLIRPGLDIDLYSDTSISTERTIALAEKWGVIEDARPIVLVPQATRDVRWLKYVAAAAENGPDALWIFVDPAGGDSEIPPHGFSSDRLRWIGSCDDLPAAIKLSSVILSLPLEPRSCDEVALDAQAMGKPVILADHGAAREMTAEGKSGWLVTANNPASLTGAVMQVLDLDSSQRAHLSVAARSFIQTNFALADTHRSMLDLYSRVATHEI
jgi:glycosyltransferase involved in cell wall biosynthesis